MGEETTISEERGTEGQEDEGAERRSERRRSPFPLPWLVAAPALAALVAFVAFTPGGLLAKTRLVGYAVCHQIASHSLTVGGEQLPLCARCTGTFLGALAGLFGQAVVLRRRRAGEFPPVPVVVFLALFMLLWAADGLNSYMTLVGGPHVYEPQNWLRTATGALNGLAMSALVYPVFNFTLWRNPSSGRNVRNLLDLGVLVLVEAGLAGLVLSAWPPLLYPLSFLSAVGVLTLLTSVNSMLVVMVVRRENVAESWRDAAVPLLAGLLVSLIEVAAIDLLRYSFTGTLGSIPIP